MQGEPPRILSFAKPLELPLHPSQRFREQYPRSLRNCASVLLQFRAERSDRTATAGQLFTIPNLDLYKTAQPLFGRLRFVQLLQQPLESRNAQLNDGVPNLVLRRSEER